MTDEKRKKLNLKWDEVALYPNALTQAQKVRLERLINMGAIPVEIEASFRDINEPPTKFTLGGVTCRPLNYSMHLE